MQSVVCFVVLCLVWNCCGCALLYQATSPCYLRTENPRWLLRVSTSLQRNTGRYCNQIGSSQGKISVLAELLDTSMAVVYYFADM